LAAARLKIALVNIRSGASEWSRNDLSEVPAALALRRTQSFPRLRRETNRWTIEAMHSLEERLPAGHGERYVSKDDRYAVFAFPEIV
jgi:hypothetical protein